MTDRELMQQALDVIEAAIKAGDWKVDGACDPDYLLEALRARLAEPEPEPVAKMKEVLEVQGRDGNWNFDPYMQGMFNGMELMMSLAERRDPAFRKAPDKWLHASPPQREWKGLTDEEIMKMLDYGQYGKVPAYARNFVDAIEAKLKEKNT